MDLRIDDEDTGIDVVELVASVPDGGDNVCLRAHPDARRDQDRLGCSGQAAGGSAVRDLRQQRPVRAGGVHGADTTPSRRDLVPAIWLPTPTVRAERKRARRRLHLVRHRTALKNRIHATLLAFGHPCRWPTCSASAAGNYWAGWSYPNHGPPTPPLPSI